MPHSHEGGFATTAIHAGYDPSEYNGSLNVPVFMTSTYSFDTTQQGSDAFSGKNDHPIYQRLSCPTTDVLEKRMAALEKGEAGISFASGMGAISATIWTLTKAGDHLLISTTLYGCTWAMFKGMRRFGLDIEPMKFDDVDEVLKRIRPNTRVVYFETPANPSNTIIDIERISKGAKGIAPNCVVVVDNTFATPFITTPISLGADVVVHSATKYICGHGDCLGGIVVSSQEICGHIRSEGLKDLTGAVMAPMTAHLMIRGLKTLALRMQKHSDNAMKVFEFLKADPRVSGVCFPYTKEGKQGDVARKQMRMPHAIVCLQLEGGFEVAKRMMDNLQLCKRAVSLGDCETLLQHPASMTHATYSPEELEAAGISPSFIRISVGLEDPEDILADLAQALDAALAGSL
eukprot:gnl/Chilomastix_cuspidata/45.p1 GENE.gnl/Chilomastix_cuspidata/45~~gnl/Chilomastix_cuspidata/45.p1  ORF type:complete len:403 (+),score=89.65 gnl/Chilomastix_cuspidata/45:175-1383(+)